MNPRSILPQVEYSELSKKALATGIAFYVSAWIFLSELAGFPGFFDFSLFHSSWLKAWAGAIVFLIVSAIAGYITALVAPRKKIAHAHFLGLLLAVLFLSFTLILPSADVDLLRVFFVVLFVGFVLQVIGTLTGAKLHSRFSS